MNSTSSPLTMSLYIRNYFLLLGLSILFTACPQKESLTQANNTDITSSVEGVWHPENSNYNIEIFKKADELRGKIIWMKQPLDDDKNPKLDKLNPNRKLRTQQVLNMVNLHSFYYNSNEQQWEEGYVYFPETGETLFGKITLMDNNTIEVAGFIGFSLEEVKQTWKRL